MSERAIQVRNGACGALLLAAALWLATAAAVPAQQVGSGAAESLLLSNAAAARITARKWTYVTRLFGGPLVQRLGFRTLEVRPATFAGVSAWVIIDSRQLATVTLRDTLYVARSDLHPLHAADFAPGRASTSEFGSDSIRTSFTGDSGATAVAVAAEPRVVGSPYLIELLLGAEPLDSTWRGTARLAVASPDGAAIIAVHASTIGAEKVLIPDGEFDCWVIALDIGASRQRIWVRKSDGVVVKERIPVVGMEAEVENLLAARGVGP